PGDHHQRDQPHERAEEVVGDGGGGVGWAAVPGRNGCDVALPGERVLAARLVEADDSGYFRPADVLPGPRARRPAVRRGEVVEHRGVPRGAATAADAAAEVRRHLVVVRRRGE